MTTLPAPTIAKAPISIPQRIADYIGLQPGRRGGTQVQTASGTVTMYENLIDKLYIGNINLTFVSAVINPSDRSETILLGMSALKKLECSLIDDKLLLRQRNNR